MEVFKKLSSIDVSAHIEKKGKFNYLSWAWAWAEVQKLYTATRTVYKNGSGWNYHTDGRTAWVEVGVTIDGVEHIDMLPVMNMQNKSLPIESVTSFDVNKAIQRATVKALALHGLGLHIYAGEDLPMTEKEKEYIIPSQALQIESACETSDMVEYIKGKLAISDFLMIELCNFDKTISWIKAIVIKQKSSLITEIKSFKWKHQKHQVNAYNKYLGTLNEHEASIENLITLRDHLIENGEEESTDE